ncbi:hypothetical protein D9758_008218 [Tetrapyrgos nigripes]|uniref:glutathione transferase n=1 Tax=Tetrapyrgos nigripes TaxID=182062 RepID=A0A8H5LFL7_9AGAR|nr:hypothetical protein D9758_008218 [Tetrapyrgos nigripes]
MPIVLHHLNNSRSQRILWLLEELGVPYEITNYQRLPNQQAPPELIKVHPLGKSPVITDGDVTIAESGAIIGTRPPDPLQMNLYGCSFSICTEYLIKKYGDGKFSPDTEIGRVNDLYFLHYAEGSVMPPLVNKLIFSMAPNEAPWFIRPLVRMIMNRMSTGFIEPEIQKHADLVESHLSKNDWFAGGSGPTAADFSMAMVIEVFVMLGYAGPGIKAHVEKVKARPAWQSAMDKGGEYMYASKL